MSPAPALLSTSLSSSQSSFSALSDFLSGSSCLAYFLSWTRHLPRSPRPRVMHVVPRLLHRFGSARRSRADEMTPPVLRGSSLHRVHVMSASSLATANPQCGEASYARSDGYRRGRAGAPRLCAAALSNPRRCLLTCSQTQVTRTPAQQ